MTVLPPQPFAQPAAVALGRAVRCDESAILVSESVMACGVWARVGVGFNMPSVPCPVIRVMKKSGSDEDVFSAVGGMELGRHDAASSSAAAAQGIPQGALLGTGAAAQSPAQANLGPQHAAVDGSNPFSAPAIGDLPFSETPSRTLIVRNVAASRSDQDLQHLFEASVCWSCRPSIRPSPHRNVARACMQPGQRTFCTCFCLLTICQHKHGLGHACQSLSQSVYKDAVYLQGKVKAVADLIWSKLTNSYAKDILHAQVILILPALLCGLDILMRAIIHHICAVNDLKILVSLRHMSQETLVGWAGAVRLQQSQPTIILQGLITF